MASFLDRLAERADPFLNPILVKELRTTFRGWRFMAIHSGFLALMAAGLVVVVLAQSDKARVKPEDVGVGLHGLFLAGLLFAAVFVLPSFASTAIVGEREQNTLEMLNTTTLSPGAVVRGKFLASMVYSAVFLFSALPLGAIAFLFGGVKIGSLALAFGLVFAVSAVSNMFSLFISVHLKNSRTALGSAAIFGLFLSGAGLGYFFSALDLNQRVKAADLLGIGGFVRSTQWVYRLAVEPEPLDVFLKIAALPLFLLVSAFAFAAVSASNRLKGSSGNKSTNLKLFFTAFVALGSALWLTLLHRTSFGSEWSRWSAAAVFLGALGVVTTLSTYFSAEDPFHSLARRLRRRTGFFFLDAFRPGSFNGLVFSAMMTAASLSAALPVLGAFMGGLFFLPLAGLGLTIASFMLLSGAAGLFLSTLVKVEWVRMGMQSAVVMTVLFLPLIAYAAMHGFRDVSGISALEPGLLSPVVAFGSLTSGFYESLRAVASVREETPFPYGASLFGSTIPAFVPAVVFNSLAAAALLTAARIRLRRRKVLKTGSPGPGDTL